LSHNGFAHTQSKSCIRGGYGSHDAAGVVPAKPRPYHGGCWVVSRRCVVFFGVVLDVFMSSALFFLALFWMFLCPQRTAGAFFFLYIYTGKHLVYCTQWFWCAPAVDSAPHNEPDKYSLPTPMMWSNGGGHPQQQQQQQPMLQRSDSVRVHVCMYVFMYSRNLRSSATDAAYAATLILCVYMLCTAHVAHLMGEARTHT
jgi:hypothetical protein